MEKGRIILASTRERESLERLGKYLERAGVECRVDPVEGEHGRFALTVSEKLARKARRALQDIVPAEGAENGADEVIEIRCEPGERDAIAAWLQALLEEHDEDGTPVFFYREHYEALLDSLLKHSRAEATVFLLRGLRAFLPEGPRRLMLSPALQEFFHLIDAVSGDSAS